MKAMSLQRQLAACDRTLTASVAEVMVLRKDRDNLTKINQMLYDQNRDLLAIMKAGASEGIFPRRPV